MLSQRPQKHMTIERWRGMGYSVQQGMTSDHRVRTLIPPGNWAFTDPFL